MHDDPLFRRVWRLAAVFCLLATVIAWFGWGTRVAVGVLGGGLLIGISLVSLGGGVAALVSTASRDGGARRNMAGALLKVVLRYALLGFLAYVMIARLRLHPIGLLVGASSIAAAAFFEAARLLSQKSS